MCACGMEFKIAPVTSLVYFVITKNVKKGLKQF